MIRALYFLIFLLGINLVHAQYPGRYTLGKEELDGAHIYNILQASDGVYWIATSQGMYKYDGYSFKTLPSKGMVVESYFGLKEDYNGQVYCHNFSGQIAVLQNDTVKLYYEIPDSLKSSYMFYDFDSENRLVIGSKALFRVKEGKVNIISNDIEYPSNFSDNVRMPNGDLVVVGSYDRKITIGTETCTIEQIPDRFPPKQPLQPILFENEVLIIERYTGKLVFGSKNTSWKAEGTGHTYLISKDIVFEVGRVTGMCIAGEGGELIHDEFISSVWVDEEGNILAGTFGKGIIVIPHRNIKTWNNLGERSPIRIETISDTSVLVLCDDKSIWEINENGEARILEGITSTITLFRIPNTRWILVHDASASTNIFNLDTKEKIRIHIGCAKSFKDLGDGSYVCASEVGMNRFTLEFGPSGIRHTVSDPIYGVTSRSYSGFFDKDNGLLYAGTRYGLKVGKNESLKEIRLDGKRISTKDVAEFKEKVYLATGSSGILIFDQDSIVGSIDEENGLSDNWVRGFKYLNNGLLCLTGNGIDFIDEWGEVSWSINQINGLSSKGYLDAAITKNKIWFLGSESVEWTNLEEFLDPIDYPEFSISYFNSDGEKIDTTNKTFTHDQSGFKMEFSSPTLRYHKFIEYEYRMIGLDTAWKTKIDYFDRVVEYEYLPDGDYTFEARYKLGDFKSPTHSYTFKIQPPFWRTWWFYIGAALAIVFFMWVVFRLQLRRQQKIARIERDAVASKLQAVQSQMNPHFIFNSLNSIQDLVLEKEGENAYIYLNKFSFLMRSVLEFSQKEFISIDDELALLEVYLDLEKLRFEEDFNYTIECNVTGVQVPPMLIQPFVENAIKHGLLHKEKDRELKISLNMENEVLHCKVHDNGIGRRAAEIIKKRKGNTHKSFSVEATMDRLAVLRSVFDKEFTIKYQDLPDEKGTIVHIRMPYRRSF